MRVVVAMSGGVDSSVAAALLRQAGHEVVGVTMQIWPEDGPQRQAQQGGCCALGAVSDARAVAELLDIPYYVFTMREEFERHVIARFAAAYAAGRTPNPCVACNQHIKFRALLEKARRLGAEALATGHYARLGAGPDGRPRLLRALDRAKDQSYVLHMLNQDQLARVMLPIGPLTKAEVRERAARLGLRTATKPDSQDVCFISKHGGRAEFLGTRIPLRSGRLVDTGGHQVGTVEALQLVTVGQRRGLGHPATRADRRYALDVDIAGGSVTVGSLEDLLTDHIEVTGLSWVDEAPSPDQAVEVQVSAHGRPTAGTWRDEGGVALEEPIRRVAPGQSVVLYHGDAVVGGGVAVTARR